MTYADLLFVALAVGLLGYCVLVLLVFKRTRDPALAMVLLLASYWSVLGAFPLLLAKRVEGGLTYTYMEDRLFPILIDGDYATTLLAYLGFMICTAVLALVFGRDTSRRTPADTGWTALAQRFSHPTLLTLAGAVTAAKLGIVLLLLRASGASGMSLYVATRTVKGEGAGYLRIYQYLNIISSYSIACGLALWLGYRGVARLSRPMRWVVWIGYLGLAAEVLGENAVLGNRAVPLIVMAAAATGWIRWGFMTAAKAQRGPLAVKFAALVAVGLFALGTIGVSRGGSLASPQAVLDAMVGNVTKIGNVVGQVVGSSEMLASHMSLYGVVREDHLALDPWASNSYAAYADLVQAPEDQVFTVHYVAAWWLRLGPVGVLAAIGSLAAVLVLLQRIAWHVPTLLRGAFGLPAAVLPAAGVPVTVLRSGPESLRAVLIELVILPGLVCFVALFVGGRRPRSSIAEDSLSADPPLQLASSRGETHA